MELRQARTLNIETGEWDAGLAPAEVVNNYALIIKDGKKYVSLVKTVMPADKPHVVTVRNGPEGMHGSFQWFIYNFKNGTTDHVSIDMVSRTAKAAHWDPRGSDGSVTEKSIDFSDLKRSTGALDIEVPVGTIGKRIEGLEPQLVDPDQTGIGYYVSKPGQADIYDAGLLPEFMMVHNMLEAEKTSRLAGTISRTGSAAVTSQVSPY